MKFSEAIHERTTKGVHEIVSEEAHEGICDRILNRILVGSSGGFLEELSENPKKNFFGNAKSFLDEFQNSRRTFLKSFKESENPTRLP